ncbi:helix-turn-helix transcriptional regulator [Streptomyces sp. NPDC046984]|uniref:helix-turn-helix transcriptional regulator n=1 Tax=Streptomyces sp. NPDC046984 TaxID=3155138 RepID=UPI0033DCC650
MPSEVRSRVKQGRLRCGMTLRELAEKCAAVGTPVGQSTLSRIERGKQVPRPKLRSVLAQLLELDVDDFEYGVRPETEMSGSPA